MTSYVERLGLSPGKPPASMALLVVDMQYFDAHRDWGEGRTARDLGVAHLFEDYFAQIDQVTPVIAELLAAFRGKSMEVIHIRVAELTSDSRDVGYKQLVRGLIVPSDSKEAEFLPGLEPTDDEIVISKSSSGVFAATNCDRILRNLGIDTLAIVGTSTGGCVQSAVYDATDLGYRTVVVTDACADSTRESHEACLASYETQSIELVSSEALIAALSSLPDVDSKMRSGLERVRAYQLDEPYKAEDGKTEPYAAIFGPAVQLRPSPDKTALVLIDAQRLTCDAAYHPTGVVSDSDDRVGYHVRAEAAVANMSKLLSMCRVAGTPVFHIRTANQLSPARSSVRPHQRTAPSTTDPRAEFMPGVTPFPGEAVLNKPGSSVFNGTGLDLLLQNAGIETLVVAGASLNSSIEASLRSAGDRGYGTILVHEACLAQAAAQAKLGEMERGIINVKDLAELERYLA